MSDIGSAADLNLRLEQGRRVAFLVGAPFSWDQGMGVPSVWGFLDIIKDRAEEAGPKYVERLNEELGEASDSQKYQAAMSCIYSTIGPAAVSDIVRRAVLKARRADAPELNDINEPERDPENWYVSRGQEGLARLMKVERERFRGPIFTTNFDPLIGLALQQQALSPIVHPMAADGTLSANQQPASEEVEVYHLHGYWRQSATLHKPEQLLSKRPVLQGSLEAQLNGVTLVVMAYSGWDDIFTEAIARCIQSPSFSGEVLWCFYEDIPEVAAARHADLLAKFDAGRRSGQISFYSGIDCHTFFDNLLSDIEPKAPVREARAESPIPGWELVSKSYLESMPVLSEAEAIRFFDGAVPTWRHAQSPRIPRLSHADTLRDRINKGLAEDGACALQLIRAAGGEGKSTGMLQASVDVIRTNDITALYQVSKDARLHSDQIEALDSDTQWLVIADDAEGLVDDLWACTERLHALGRANVVFLVAARDADWRQAHADQKAWSTRLSRLADVQLGGIEPDDAARIVEAWEQHGDAGLRALKDVTTAAERAARLVEATQAQDVRRGDGSFFGGLLDTRFSPEGLVDHLVELMRPLKHRDIPGGFGSLYDALIYIANCHAVGMPGIDRRMLAAFCGVERHLVFSNIVAPLGRELGAGESQGHVLTRHRKVAEAIVVASERRFDTDLAEVWERLVRETAAYGRKEHFGNGFHGAVVHAGTRLKRDLPDGLDARRRGNIGIAAAEVAMEAMPEWSSTIVDRARALRFAAQGRNTDDARELLMEACGVMKRSLGLLNKADDKAEIFRGYFYEWGTCVGNIGDRQGSIMSTWLAAFSLSDKIPVEVTLERAKLSCAGLGVALGHLIGGDPESAFAKGRRAVTEIGWLTNPDPKTAGYFETHEHAVNELGTLRPADLDEALSWLTIAAKEAHGELQDALIKKFVPTGRLTFSRLKAAVTK